MMLKTNIEKALRDIKENTCDIFDVVMFLKLEIKDTDDIVIAHQDIKNIVRKEAGERAEALMGAIATKENPYIFLALSNNISMHQFENIEAEISKLKSVTGMEFKHLAELMYNMERQLENMK